MRQKRLIGLVLAGTVASSGVGWAAGTRLKSPAQVAAEAAPPAPSPITAPVENKKLSSVVTTRGTVRYGQPQSVTLAASSIAGAGTGGGGAASKLVTRPPDKGAMLEENAVALEVSGRPVRVLRGDVPIYRDLRPGDKGNDVRQLEEALERLGFRPAKVDGVYDVATEAAVDAWYSASGYTAQGPSDEQREKLRAAKAAVNTAEERVLQQQDAYESAAKGATPRELAQAEAEVRTARRTLREATEDLDTAKAAETEARAVEQRARSDQERIGNEGRRRVEQATALVRERERELAAAQEEQQRAEEQLRRDEDSGAPPEQLQRDREAVGAAREAVRDAAEALAEARRGQQEAQSGAEETDRQAAAAVEQAVQGVAQAAKAAQAAARQVDAAADALAAAQANVDALKKPGDTRLAAAQLETAKRGLAEAKQQLGELEGQIGVVVPANEVLFFPSLPLRVDEPKVKRGDDATKEVMVVSTSSLAVDAAVAAVDAKLVEVGDQVKIVSSELGIETTGTVSRLADKPGTNGVDAQKVYMEVQPDALPPELTGAAVRLSIEVESTASEVLAVPVSALSLASDGTTRVQVIDSGGRSRTVTVEPGLTANGFAEVRPQKGELSEGDRVLVGTKR